MGLADKFIKLMYDPDKLVQLADKAQKAVSDNQTQLQGAIDKAEAIASKKTGGKYDQKITKVSDAASGTLNKVTGAATDTEPAAKEPSLAVGQTAIATRAVQPAVVIKPIAVAKPVEAVQPAVVIRPLTEKP